MENEKRYYSKKGITQDILTELFDDDSVFMVRRDEVLQKLVDAGAYSSKQGAAKMGEMSNIAAEVGFSVEKDKHGKTIYVKRKKGHIVQNESYELGRAATNEAQDRILNAIGVYYSAIRTGLDEIVGELQKLRIDVSEEVLEDIVERVIKKIL